MTHDLLKLGDRITVMPIIHGSGDFALEVRRLMLQESFDCVAVPLPPSFQEDLESAITLLPAPTVVTQSDRPRFRTEWNPEVNSDDDDSEPVHTYVPVDPCQGVIMALRIAMGEHITRAYIDLDTANYEPVSAILPDPYALKSVPVERFAAAALPGIERPPPGQPTDRIRYMASRLRELAAGYRSVLVVCSILEWPWIREAFGQTEMQAIDSEDVEETSIYQVQPRTLLFMLGELPFVTGLYERARAELEDDENLTIDGVKELLMAARTTYRREFKGRCRRITPHTLSLCLKYIRNLSLVGRRMSPDLFTIVTAAKQTVGDGYALHVAEQAANYLDSDETSHESIEMGIEQGRLPDGTLVEMISRLPGPPLQWRSCDLQRRPEKEQRQRWGQGWNPYSQCSWPAEDELIENFRTHVCDRAKAIMGADLVRTEKFTTSIKDGIDIRDTLRNWHTGEIYVKVLPPAQGDVDTVVMLFDSPADPRQYRWRTTWFAEHANESTLAFFATDFRDEMVGPGIGLATYGGALFLYPPVAIPDIWNDPRLDFAETLEERLLAAACLHSRSRHICLLSSLAPGAGFRQLARRFGKRWVHVPLAQFSDSTVQQLRMVHVLGGKEVRSYAAHFIRRP